MDHLDTVAVEDNHLVEEGHHNLDHLEEDRLCHLEEDIHLVEELRTDLEEVDHIDLDLGEHHIDLEELRTDLVGDRHSHLVGVVDQSLRFHLSYRMKSRYYREGV